MIHKSGIYQDILDAENVLDSFPRLAGNFERTSDPTIRYNCLAHAININWAWFQPPNHLPGYYWPPGIAPEWNADTIKQILVKFGFTEFTELADVEEGYNKIAVYAETDGTPSHFAVQLANGNWSSKLGDLIDIEHYNLDCLTGDDQYGQILYFAKRKVTAAK